MFRLPRPRVFPALAALVLATSGCVSDPIDPFDPFDPVVPGARLVEVDIRVVIFEPQNRPVLNAVELLLDGETIARQNLLPSVHTIEISGERTVLRGRHIIGIRIVGQTSSPTLLNFFITIHARELLTLRDQTIAIGGQTTPRTEVFRTNEIITIPVLIEP